MGSCILHQNVDQTITILDIPRSIEQAQGSPFDQKMCLISSQAIDQPFASVEPKSKKALGNLEVASVKSLLIVRAVELAIEEMHTIFKQPWCLPRVTQERAVLSSQVMKRQALDPPGDASIYDSKRALYTGAKPIHDQDVNSSERYAQGGLISDIFYHNEDLIFAKLKLGFDSRAIYVPPRSTFIQGDVESTLTTFNLKAPLFNLVILDPPWPNRSARRKKSYQISKTSSDIVALLSSIPISEHLAEDALVGIWVTNKPAIHDIVLDRNGLFDAWGLKLVEERVWVKTTTSGEPVCALDSTWRKPYEILFVGRKRGSDNAKEEFKRRIIFGVPDLHSRKPNLKVIFEPMLPLNYEALEVFARNLTEGWWAWGNEVLKFQSEEHWLDNSNDT